jgi:hypothetical protein
MTSSRVRRLVERQSTVESSMRRKFIPRATASAWMLRGPLAGCNDDGVEEARGRHLMTALLEPDPENRRQAVHAPGDRRQARRAVIDRVHGGHHREQHLRRADVRRRLLAPDVLLARLQREPVRGIAEGVYRHADEPAGIERLKSSRVAR